MKKLILVFYALVVMTGAFSQQEREVSHYMYDQISVNPGSAGNSDMISTHGIFRQQWVGMDGTPGDYIFNLSAPFKLGNTHHGVGLALWQDKLGFNSDIDASLSYAYQFSVGNGRLGLGISGSFIDRAVNPTWVLADDVPTDPDIPWGKQNVMAFDMGAGLFYSTADLYVGISSTRILQNEFKFQGQNSSSANVKDKLARQYYLTAGYTIQMANPSLEFLPSVFLQTDTKVTRIDVNTTLMYNKKFWAGVTYRVGSAVVGMVGINILNGVKIGYAYDFDTSKLMSVSKGTHEIMLGYDFRIGVEKIPQKYKSIRYL